MKFDIYPNDISLFEVAFLHESFSNENNICVCYERLEFLGDSVLDLLVSEYLFKKNKNFSEGQLTNIRSNYVCKQALYEYSTTLGLDKLVKVGECEKISSREKKSIISDIFESFIGAVYLDQGIEKVNDVLSTIVFKHIDNGTTFFIDYKSKLKEKCDSMEWSLKYQVVKEAGMPHDKTFTIVVLVNNNVLGYGVGGNKKEAEQKAASIALTTLK